MRILVASKHETVIKEVGHAAYIKHLGGFNAPTGYYDNSFCEDNGVPWGLDNGAFVGFRPDVYKRILARYSNKRSTCKFRMKREVVDEA